MKPAEALPDLVFALGEKPIFEPGDRVHVSDRSPIGHYRVPTYLRGKPGTVESAIEPIAVDNEEEGYGRNAGSRLHYYRVAFAMTDIWPHYTGVPHDRLYIEIFETWLERTAR
jgi:nitrile hydratase